jgi:uncharacterized protein
VIRQHDFRHNGLTLRSTVHVPDADGSSGGRWPTAVFVHGFTSNRLELPNFVAMSRLLAANGIASVRFDLSGQGESDGDFFDVTVTGEIAETRAVLRTVRTLDFVDPGRIGLVGMSLGGVVAGIVAAEEPGIGALCLWSPAAVAPFEAGNGYVKGRPAGPEIEEKGYMDADGYRVSPAFVEDMARLDVYARSAAYRGPVQILHGAKDDIAPLDYVRRYLDHYDGNAELDVVPGADHTWGSVPHRRTLHDSTLRFLRRHLQ